MSVIRRNWLPAAIVAALFGMLYWVGNARGVSSYYASPTGGGTTCSLAAPCTFQYLANNKAMPGDTVWLRGGTYVLLNDDGSRFFRRAGTADAPIIYRNYNNEHVKMDCKGPFSNSSWLGNCLGSVNVGAHDVWMWGFDLYNSSTQSRYNPTEITEPQWGIIRGRIINNFIRDMADGVLVHAQDGININATVYGNYFQYSGEVGDSRSHGHDIYAQNPYAGGEANRSYFIDNVGLRAFDIQSQMYSTGDMAAYTTWQGNVQAAAGHAAYPTMTWSGNGTSSLYYLGIPLSSPRTSCSDTKLLRALVFDSNVAFGGGNNNFGMGAGSCNTSFTNNYFLQDQPTVFTPNGTMAPLAFTGNHLTSTTGGGPVYVNSSTYPSNTWSLPTTTTMGARPNQYESGRGFIWVYNPTDAASVTIPQATLEAAGCYAGEALRIFNYQDNNPWDSTPIATQTGCAAVSLPTTIAAAAITQPGFTTDGSTPFPKPADTGPRFVVFMLYPSWTAGATPTATSTYTPTNTPTLTPSRTPTQTFTPSVTFTPTVTTTATLTPSLTPTQTFTPSATPTPNPTPPANQNSFSVSSCTATLPMVVQADATAFGGYSASSITSNYGKLECPFNVTADGLYRVWTRVNGPSSLEDSFYLDVNGDSLPDGMTDGDTTNPHVFDIAESRQPCTGAPSCNYEALRNQWIWNVMNDRTATCGDCTGNFTERDLTLTAGANTLSFRTRDHNSKIAWIFVTNDFGFDPNQSPLPPTATPTPTPTGTITPAPSATPTSTGTITAVPTSTRTPTPLPGTCRKWIQCNGKGAFIEAPCSQIKNRRPPIPCPW